MLRRALILVILAGVTAVPLQGQTSPRERARATMSSALFQEVEALAAGAATQGVPADPIFNKALEGMAKRVPQPLLLNALHSYSDRMGTARMAFGRGASSPMLVAGADALQRGVAPEALGGLRERGAQSPMAVLVLADLVETGVPSEQALAVLGEAMGRRMGEDMMLEIPGHVRGYMREGHSAGAAADRVWSMMRSGMWGMGGGMKGTGGMMGPGMPPGGKPPGG